MLRILVTGGSGFIGSNFVHAAHGQGYELLNLDKLTYAGNPRNLASLAHSPRYRFIQGDIADRELCGRLLREFRPDWLVHFAAESHVDRSIDGPEAFVLTNVNGTFRLLDEALRYWRELEGEARAAFRFLHVSTDEVYGSLGPSGLFREDTAYAPNSPYSASKAASDHFVRAYHHTYGMPTLTTNCSNNYGPYQFPEKLIPVVILKALRLQPLPIYGDGGNIRDWLYVGDHVEAILRVLRGGRVGETYNIGGDSERTNLQVAKHICAILDELRPSTQPHESLITFVKDRPGHDRRYAIDAGKLRAELGWSPAHSFEKGMEDTVRWYLEHQAWCDEILSGAYRLERLGKLD